MENLVLDDAIRRAIEEEREECAKAMCNLCRWNKPDADGMHNIIADGEVIDRRPCNAMPIRNRMKANRPG